jgi:hypothetical protein
MSKKAEAALEFLSTYGWAMMIILIMIGALSYFGVLNPGRFIGDRCVAGTPFYCSDKLINDTSRDYVQMKVRNGVSGVVNFTVGTTYELADGTTGTCRDSGGAVGTQTNIFNTSGTGEVISALPQEEFTFRCYMAGTDSIGNAGDKKKVLISLEYFEGGDNTFSKRSNFDVYTTLV